MPMTSQDIRQLRADLGWRGSDLAHYLGVTPGTVSGWENGFYSPDEYRVAAMQQLRNRFDQIETEKAREEFIKGLKIAAVSGGVFLLLKYLFSED